MATQIKVSVDNDEIILEGDDAENVLKVQSEIQQTQDDLELAAANKAAARQAVYQKLGLTDDEIAALAN